MGYTFRSSQWKSDGINWDSERHMRLYLLTEWKFHHSSLPDYNVDPGWSDAEISVADSAARYLRAIGSRPAFDLPESFYDSPGDWVKPGKGPDLITEGLSRVFANRFSNIAADGFGFFYAYRNGTKGWLCVYNGIRQSNCRVSSVRYFSTESRGRMNMSSSTGGSSALNGSAYILLRNPTDGELETPEICTTDNFYLAIDRSPIDASCKNDSDVWQVVVARAIQVLSRFDRSTWMSLGDAVSISESVIGLRRSDRGVFYRDPWFVGLSGEAHQVDILESNKTSS